MSSEALARAKWIREALDANVLTVSEQGGRTATHDAAVADLDALLAEVARLEQERAAFEMKFENANGSRLFQQKRAEAAEAALAVAREREQRLREALGAYRSALRSGEPESERLRTVGDAALVGEPAAAGEGARATTWATTNAPGYAIGFRKGEPAAATLAEPGAGHDLCACGATLTVCHKCGDSRCLACDPYDERDTCGAARGGVSPSGKERP